MTEQSTTQALGSTTVVFGWVEEAWVQQVLHASDGFQLLLAITLAGFGGAVADGVALVAGALHPIGLYLILCGLLVGTGLAGVMMVREYNRYRKVRRQLLAATARMPVSVWLVTPGPASPSFTVGGQEQVGQNLGLTQPGTTLSSQMGLPVADSETRVPDHPAEGGVEGS